MSGKEKGLGPVVGSRKVRAFDPPPGRAESLNKPGAPPARPDGAAAARAGSSREEAQGDGRRAPLGSRKVRVFDRPAGRPRALSKPASNA